jgi:hypothetical protein
LAWEYHGILVLCMEHFPRKRDTPKFKLPHELHPS